MIGDTSFILLKLFFLIALASFLISCKSESGAAFSAAVAGDLEVSVTVTKPVEIDKTINSNSSTRPAPVTITPLPTSTNRPSPKPSSTPTISPTPTPIGPCDSRLPTDELLTVVTRDYGLSRNYAPSDLVPIANYFPISVTLGYPTEIRQITIDPLREMIADMLSAGLQPQIISGYRSYSAQAIAWRKWLENEPERASIVSAPPGYSEHQLGTTIDFGSPELAEIVDDQKVEFHTYFYKTKESQWLTDHAHEYGFTLSYPREAFELTGFFYEPWHYRYVGQELAMELKERNITLTQYLLETQPAPCIP